MYDNNQLYNEVEKLNEIINSQNISRISIGAETFGALSMMNDKPSPLVIEKGLSIFTYVGTKQPRLTSEFSILDEASPRGK
jgi:hypothetical protein